MKQNRAISSSLSWRHHKNNRKGSSSSSSSVLFRIFNNHKQIIVLLLFLFLFFIRSSTSPDNLLYSIPADSIQPIAFEPKKTHTILDDPLTPIDLDFNPKVDLNLNLNLSLNLNLNLNFDPKESWGIVHLGKCGGVGMRHTFFKEKKNLRLKKIFNTGKWYHISSPDVNKFRKWVLLVRDPIARIQSWYMYDHPDNFLWRTDRFGWPVKSQKAKHLFQCYPTLDKLATEGLVKYSPSNSQCQHLAHMAIPYTGSGWLTGLQHVRWNFFRYYNDLMQYKQDNTFFVVRAENMEHDLNTIGRFIGDTEKITRLVRVSHWENSSYPMSNRTMSETGLDHLCQQLCNEIQLYKTILRSALNLDNAAYAQAMNQLKPKCPTQVDSDLCPPRAPNKWSYETHMNNLLMDEVNQLTHDHNEWRLRANLQQGIVGQEDKIQKLIGVASTQIAFLEIPLTGGANIQKTLQESGANTVLGKRYRPQIWFSKDDPELSTYETLIVTLRDPIDRILTWWIHDHPQNQKFRVHNTSELNQASKQDLRQRQKFFNCFDTFDKLISVGLRPVHTPDSKAWDECQRIARRAIPRRGNGIVPTLDALNFNYERAFKQISKQGHKKLIFVIRSEPYQRGDTFWINKLLGGGENDFQNRIQKEKIWTVDESQLPVPPSAIETSSTGFRHLCAQLCREIQVYKMLIHDALNLRERAYAEAVDKISKICPTEAGLVYDSCP